MDLPVEQQGDRLPSCVGSKIMAAAVAKYLAASAFLVGYIFGSRLSYGGARGYLLGSRLNLRSPKCTSREWWAAGCADSTSKIMRRMTSNVIFAQCSRVESTRHPAHMNKLCFAVWGLPYMTSANFWFFLTPLSPFVRILCTVCPQICCIFLRPPPYVRTSHMEAPL